MRTKIIAVPVLALIVVGVAFVSHSRRSPTPNGVTSATTQTEALAMPEQHLAMPTELPAAPTQQPTLPPTDLLHAVRARDMSAAEKEEVAKKLREKFRPAMERWAKAYGDRLPIAPDDVTPDKFTDRLGNDLYTFVLGDFTLTFGESTNSAKVWYLASRKAVIQLSIPPAGGEAPKTDPPVTREEIARMVQADTGVMFKPNEILMSPTGIGFAMNGGANVRVGPPKTTIAAVCGPDKLHMVFGPDGKLAYYMRDPFF